MSYRYLNKGEAIQLGDEYWIPRWIPKSGWASIPASEAGKCIRTSKVTVRRPLEENSLEEEE